jgi:hypothetical protein
VSVWRPYFTEYELSIHPVATAIFRRIFALSRITQVALEVQCLVLEGPVHLSQNEDPGRVVGLVRRGKSNVTKRSRLVSTAAVRMRIVTIVSG